GLYVTGTRSSDGFLWNSSAGTAIYFENTLNTGIINPAAVTNDGWIFGYTAEGFPPMPPGRRAFVREPNGNLTTFNDYAIGRGWFDADDWTFYAISGVSGDGNRFIGAGIDPDGNDVSFMIDFAPAQPDIEVNPLSLTETLEVDQTSEQHIEISNIGIGELTYNAVIQYVIDDAKVQEVPVGRSGLANKGNLQLDKKEGTHGFHPATKANDKNDIILNYDGANVDAIGLLAGGTFYGAARYTSEMVAPFGGYHLESVDVYIGDVPTEIKLMIWDAGTTTTPGALLHEQVFTPTPSSWNTVVLDEALEVSGADLWVGFEITHDAGVFVLGIDGGPAILDGNLLTQDPAEWEHLSDYGLNANWNIRARLQYDGIQWLTLDPVSGSVPENESQTVTVSFDANGLEPGTYTANIRISSNAVNEDLVIVPVTLEVFGAPIMYTLTILVDPEDAGTVSGAGEYFAGSVVTVNATAHEGFIFLHWVDADDQVISELAEMDITMPEEDLTITANFQTTVSVDDVPDVNLKLYPNPAVDHLHIQSDVMINYVELYDLSGRVVYREEANQQMLRIHVSALQEGLYLVRIFTERGVSAAKIQVIR
ncbi:MAG: T9SS C-terminal target domain-containing protein, partial [Bacteroidia bacterium]